MLKSIVWHTAETFQILMQVACALCNVLCGNHSQTGVKHGAGNCRAHSPGVTFECFLIFPPEWKSSSFVLKKDHPYVSLSILLNLNNETSQILLAYSIEYNNNLSYKINLFRISLFCIFLRFSSRDWHKSRFNGHALWWGYEKNC